MDANAGYVWAGYAVTAGTLVAYVVWLRLRLRRATRSLGGDAPPAAAPEVAGDDAEPMP